MTSEQHLRLSIRVTGAPEAQTIALTGEADLLGVPKLQAVFASVCNGEPGLIVLDLRGLTFIDSSGLQALVLGHQLCRVHGHELKVIPGPANIQRLFEIAGMNNVLTLGDLEPAPHRDAPQSDEPAPSA